MRRPREQRAGLAELHDFSHVHDGDAGADVFHQPQVVRDEQVREPEPIFQIEQELHHLRLDRHIERRDGFVGDDERRIERERTRDSDALTLAAAEFVGIAGLVGRLQPHQLKQLSDTSAALPLCSELVNDQRLFDDVADTHPRVQRRIRILEDDLHVAARHPHPIRREAQHVLAAEHDVAGRRFNQPEDAPAGGALAAARFADQAEHLPFVDREAHVVDRLDDRRGTQEPLLSRKMFDEVTDLEQRHQGAPGTAARRLRVYSCEGWRRTSRTGPSSTSFPLNMTATRSAISAMTPKSCVMSSSARL